MNKIVEFVKRETILVIATILAIISAFFVPPSRAYFSYIDFRVLGILLSLMLVMAGFQKNGLFDAIGKKLLQRTRNTAQLVGVLVFLCYFSSMFITNDVALLTFVPFAVLTLQKCKQERLMALVLILQTIAANLGSMLTPIGNPQNLYLYNLSGMRMGEFLMLLLPYTLVAGIVLLIIIFVLSARKQKILTDSYDWQEKAEANPRKNVAYFVLFVLCLLVVLRVLPYQIALVVVLISVFFIDRDVLVKVDYCLLFTFISFFIFTGNMGNFPAVREMLESVVTGRELFVGILTSQIISNVPAALLLSGFTKNYAGLLLGVNIGGLGTLIASMASLISYKIYAQHYNRSKAKYLFWFTVANVLFLLLLLIVANAMICTLE